MKYVCIIQDIFVIITKKSGLPENTAVIKNTQKSHWKSSEYVV